LGGIVKSRRVPAAAMTQHRYKIGQKVFIRGAARLDAPKGAYQILQRLPAENDRPRYLLSSLEHGDCKVIVAERDFA
jgi:hypothetical protein